MGIELSVSARTEITAKYARAYRAASRVVKSRLLDEVAAVTEVVQGQRQAAAGAGGEAQGGATTVGQAQEVLKGGDRDP